MLLADTSPAQGGAGPVAKETASLVLQKPGHLPQAGLGVGVGRREEQGQ